MTIKTSLTKFSLLFCTITTLLLVGCSKENTEDSIYRFEFDFDLNNHFSIQSNGDLVETDKAYLDTNYEWAYNVIHLNDGGIGDSLVKGCWGSWSGYTQNPTASVQIRFLQTNLEDGIYQYSRTGAVNDFSIKLYRNMTWGEYINPSGTTFEGTNTILNSQTVASVWSNADDPFAVEHAEIKIENINTANTEIRYVIETVSGELIKGSYSGSLDHFKLYTPEFDCD